MQSSAPSFAGRSSRGGFTLIEILVAMGIFSLVFLGLAAGATTIMRANQTSYFSTAATNLAQDKLEELQAKNPLDIIPGGPVTSTVNGVTFTRSWTVAANSPAVGLRRIDVTVSWRDYASHSLTAAVVVKE